MGPNPPSDRPSSLIVQPPPARSRAAATRIDSLRTFCRSCLYFSRSTFASFKQSLGLGGDKELRQGRKQEISNNSCSSDSIALRQGKVQRAAGTSPCPYSCPYLPDWPIYPFSYSPPQLGGRTYCRTEQQRTTPQERAKWITGLEYCASRWTCRRVLDTAFSMNHRTLLRRKSGRW